MRRFSSTLEFSHKHLCSSYVLHIIKGIDRRDRLRMDNDMNTYHITFSPNSDPDNIQRETLLADSIQQINATYQANDCTIIRFEVKTEEANHTACLLSDAMKDCDNCKFQPEVAPWDVIRDLGTRFIISGGEVLELDSHLESAYDERNGDIETDMPY